MNYSRFYRLLLEVKKEIKEVKAEVKKIKDEASPIKKINKNKSGEK